MTSGMRRRTIGVPEYVARIVVEKIEHYDVIEGQSGYEKIVQGNVREKQEVASLVVKNPDLNKLKSLLVSHTSLIDDTDGDGTG